MEHSTFARSKTFQWNELPSQTRERLRELREKPNDPLRFQKIVRPAVWMFRWRPPVVATIYLHPAYLLVFQGDRVQVSSWAYLSSIYKEGGTLSFELSHEQSPGVWVHDERISKNNELPSLEAGEAVDAVVETIKRFSQETREKNAQQRAHLLLEAELFPEMLQDETA